MKFKTAFPALMFLLTGVCTFIGQGARADNEGEFTPSSNPQWWWKYVRQIDKEASWSKVIQISKIAVDRGSINERTKEVTNTVVVTFTNRSAQTVECDGSVRIAHTIRDKKGGVVNSEELLPARLPKVFKPGESFTVRKTALTPSQFRGDKQFISVEAH